MRCPDCHAELRQGARFCTECGAPAPGLCPGCGTANPRGAKFCAGCGRSLAAPSAEPPAASAPAPERRHLTVMFCDLVGSTALSARLDPEDLRELIAAYQSRVAEAVRRYDGFIARYMGDGVLVYFGFPRAHEDDAERAARTGLAIVETVPALHAAEPLQVRIGVATGLVVVGDLIGEGPAQEQAVVGETPNLAARLQSLAEPNAVCIDDSTRVQIGALFELSDLGLLALKGFAEPQRAWRVLAENRALGRFEALRSGATPLVGRDEEMELLLRRWSQAKAGSGRVVLISGEPGVGKSRLAAALEQLIGPEPHVRLSHFCSPHHQDSALYPVIARLERAAGFRHDEVPAEKLAKLQAVLTSGTPPEEMALLAGLHLLQAAELAPLPDMSPQRKKELIFAALLGQVERLSQQQPVLMVFEDTHWIDPSSRELLDRTIERIADWPMLLIATFRPEFQPPWLGQPHVAMMNLARLDRRDAAAMVENIAGSAALPPDIVQEITDRTDGVPLFVEELTNAVLASGTQGASALASAPHPALSVPPTLHASLMARLDRLGPAAKDVAQKGSVIGREFGYELLAEVADLPGPQLRAALDRLANSGLVLARGTPPECTYLFKHALVQDAAYSTLLRGRRQQLHARIAAILEDRFPDIAAARLELLAHHCAKAGLTTRAAEYLLQAGEQALRRSGTREAEALLLKGVALVSRLPHGAERLERELDLQLALGLALMLARGSGAPSAGKALARARELCGRLDQPDKLSLILTAQTAFYLATSDLRAASDAAARLQKLGETSDDHPTRVAGLVMVGQTRFYLGDFVAARENLQDGLGLFDRESLSSRNELFSDNTIGELLGYLSWALACLGHLDQARVRRDTGIARARRIGYAPTLAMALTAACISGWLDRSEPAQLLPYADECLALSTQQGFTYWRGLALQTRGWCAAALGRPDEGIPMLVGGWADARATGATLGTPRHLTLLAGAYRTAGQHDAALGCLAEAERIAEASQVRWVLPETLRLRGDVLRHTGACEAAAASYDAAIALARRQGARLFELRAATCLARLWRDQGRRTQARDLLAPVHAWFTEGFDASDLIEARQLLDELA